MDNKYQIPKARKPETKQERVQHEIEQLIAKRDMESNPAAVQKINAEISTLFSQYERLKL